MSDIFIDLPTAVKTILGLIASKPEGYKYMDNPLAREGTCRNVLMPSEWHSPREIEPGCIVGAAVIKLGVEPVNIFLKDLVYAGVASLLREFGIGVTAAARMYLCNIQSNQDNGHAWLDSHMCALEWVIRYNGSMLTDSEREWLGIRQ